MTSNNSNINVETKNNTVNEMKKKHSVSSEFIIDYTYKMLKIYLKNKPSKKLKPLLVIDTQSQLVLTKFIADIGITSYRMHLIIYHLSISYIAITI